MKVACNCYYPWPGKWDIPACENFTSTPTTHLDVIIALMRCFISSSSSSTTSSTRGRGVRDVVYSVLLDTFIACNMHVAVEDCTTDSFHVEYE